MIYINNYNNLRYNLFVDSYENTLIIDNERFENLKNNTLYQISKVPNKIEVVSNEQIVKHFERCSDENEIIEVIEKDVFKSTIEKLEQEIEKYKNIDEIKYLEAQIPLTIYRRNIKTVYEYIEKIREVTPIIINYHDDKINNFVFSQRFLGNLPKDNEKLYTYKADAVAMFREIANKYGFSETGEANTVDDTKGLIYYINRGELNYSKIAGSYVREEVHKYGVYSITAGTKEECLERYNKDYAFFEKYIKEMHLKATMGENPVNIEQTLQHYNTILNQLKEINPKNNSSIEAKRILINWINKYKEELGNK